MHELEISILKSCGIPITGVRSFTLHAAQNEVTRVDVEYLVFSSQEVEVMEKRYEVREIIEQEVVEEWIVDIE